MRAAALLLITLLSFLGGCSTALKGHYQLEGEEVAAAALPGWASEKCAATGLPTPPKPFETDLCTGWPDDYEKDGSDWSACCIVHDAEYWCGGSEEQREASDRRLRECVGRETAGIHAQVMYMGVRMFAHPVWPVPWRWGFGRDYPMFYDDYETLKQAAGTDEDADDRVDEDIH